MNQGKIFSIMLHLVTSTFKTLLSKAMSPKLTGVPYKAKLHFLSTNFLFGTMLDSNLGNHELRTS